MFEVRTDRWLRLGSLVVVSLIGALLVGCERSDSAGPVEFSAEQAAERARRTLRSGDDEIIAGTREVSRDPNAEAQNASSATRAGARDVSREVRDAAAAGARTSRQAAREVALEVQAATERVGTAVEREETAEERSAREAREQPPVRVVAPTQRAARRIEERANQGTMDATRAEQRQEARETQRATHPTP